MTNKSTQTETKGVSKEMESATPIVITADDQINITDTVDNSELNKSNVTPTQDNMSTLETSVLSTRERFDIILLHDSVCKDIDLKRLTNRNHQKTKKVLSHTISEAKSWVLKAEHTGTIMIHISINDLKVKTIDVVSAELEELTRLCLDKADKVILSLPLLCKDQRLASKVAGLVNMLFIKLNQVDRLVISRNDNFSEGGKVIDKLFRDSIHPSNDGIRLLAGNFKHALNAISDSNENSDRPQQRQGDRYYKKTI